MKKLVSLLMAVSMTASLPVFPAYAEGNPDIESLAISLGADTDYLAVPNYYYPISDLPSYDYFLPPSSSNQTISLISGVGEYSDTSLGASVLSVLTHNGTISDDIIKINEINHILLAKSTIFKYQNIIEDKKFDLYTKYLLKSQSLAQKADTLVSTAEKCMNEGKYFLIMYSSIKNRSSYTDAIGRRAINHQAHSAVGIGVTDGNWTFDGKTYDKCILTLDSYNVDNENDAFSEDTCIYINSETKEYYMPKISGYAENDLHIIAVDDDQLLNSGDTDISDKIVNLKIAYDSITEVTYNDENGNSVIMNSDNDFLDNYHSKYSNSNFLLKGNDFKIYTASENDNDYITISEKNRTIDFDMEKADSEILYNYDTLKLTHRDSWGVTSRNPADTLEFTLFVYTDTSDFHYYIEGETLNDIEFKNTDGGVICSGGKVIFQFGKEEHDDSGQPYNVIHSIAFNSAGEVFVKYDENDGFGLFADLDNDGVFEHEVQKGDVNCDGQINSDDASEVLKSYADMSTYNPKKPSTYKNIYACTKYADINNDGVINALDASEILEIYSENSTR